MIAVKWFVFALGLLLIGLGICGALLNAMVLWVIIILTVAGAVLVLVGLLLRVSRLSAHEREIQRGREEYEQEIALLETNRFEAFLNRAGSMEEFFGLLKKLRGLTPITNALFWAFESSAESRIPFDNQLLYEFLSRSVVEFGEFLEKCKAHLRNDGLPAVVEAQRFYDQKMEEVRKKQEALFKARREQSERDRRKQKAYQAGRRISVPPRPPRCPACGKRAGIDVIFRTVPITRTRTRFMSAYFFGGMEDAVTQDIVGYEKRSFVVCRYCGAERQQ